MGVSKTDFGVTRDGRKASLYTIINKNGMEAVVSDFGAILVKLIVPNKDGENYPDEKRQALFWSTRAQSGSIS